MASMVRSCPSPKASNAAHRQAFQRWLAKHPDFFDMGQCTALASAQHRLQCGSTAAANIEQIDFTIGKDAMLDVVKTFLDLGRREPTLLYVTMADGGAPALHACYSSTAGRLLVHEMTFLAPKRYQIDGVVDDSLILSKSEGVEQLNRRLPGQFRMDMEPYARRQGFIQRGVFQKVYKVAAEFIACVECHAREHIFCVTGAADSSDSIATIQLAWVNAGARRRCIERLRKKMAHSPRPKRKLSKTSDIVGLLAQLKIMHDDGDLSSDEFTCAKKKLLE